MGDRQFRRCLLLSSGNHELLQLQPLHSRAPDGTPTLHGNRCMHSASQQRLQQQEHPQPEPKQQQPEQQKKEGEVGGFPDMCPPSLRLSRVVLLNKVTRFQVSLAERMAAWKRQHLSRSSRGGGNGGGVEATAATAAAAPGEEAGGQADAALYTPGSPEYEAAAAEAEAEAAAELARDFPTAYRTHLLHQRAAAELCRQLREEYGLHVTRIEARTVQGLRLTRTGTVALPPDAIISAGGDGTYLEAASIIPGHLPGGLSGPWLFGVNTDPLRSEGRLCVKPTKQVQQQEKQHHELQQHELQQEQHQPQQQQQHEQQQKQQHPQQGSLGVGAPLVFQTPRAPGPLAVTPSQSSLLGVRAAEGGLGGPQAEEIGSLEEAEEAAYVQAYVHRTLQHLLQGGARLVARQRIRLTLCFYHSMQQQVMECLAAITPHGPAVSTVRSSSSAGGSSGSFRGNASTRSSDEGTAQEAGPPRGPLAAGSRHTDSERDEYSVVRSPQTGHGDGRLLKQEGGSSVWAEGNRAPLAGGRGVAQVCGPCFEGLTFDAAAARQREEGEAALREEIVELCLPFLSVNDVFVSEANVAKTLYADVWVDGTTRRHKSSGVLVSTGTGSSAWNYNMGSIGREQAKAVAEQLMKLRPQLKATWGPLTDEELQQIVLGANHHLLLDPGALLLRFLVREPIHNRVFSGEGSMGMGREVRVKPLAGEIVVALDGLVQLQLPPLVEIRLSVHPSDALWTVQ